MVTGVPTMLQDNCTDADSLSAEIFSETILSGMCEGDFIIERAKNFLLSTNNPVSQIAYDLGFEYPQHFAKLFKAKTGLNPTDYRTVN